MESLQFLKEYCNFSNPNWVWMLKGISRNKDNDKSGVRFIRRLVVAKPEDIETCRADILKMANDPDTTYRLYVSLNSRDVVKGLFNFQKKMIDIGMGLAQGLDDHLQMSKKIGSIWKTELEQRSCRGTKRFLFDLDEDDNLMASAVAAYLETKVGTTIHLIRHTVSGYHIVFDACDTRGLHPFCKEQGIPMDKNTLQRDSMVFVEQWKGNGQ